MWTAECPLCKSSQSLTANLTQQVSISEEPNILFWHNKKSDKLSEQLGTAPQQSTNLQFKLSRVTCARQRRMIRLSVCTTPAEGLHIFFPDCHKPGQSQTATTSRLLLRAGCCATRAGQRHSANALSRRSACIQTDLISSSDRAAFSTWPGVFIDKNNMLVFPWHSC